MILILTWSNSNKTFLARVHQSQSITPVVVLRDCWAVVFGNSLHQLRMTVMFFYSRLFCCLNCRLFCCLNSVPMFPVLLSTRDHFVWLRNYCVGGLIFGGFTHPLSTAHLSPPPLDNSAPNRSSDECCRTAEATANILNNTPCGMCGWWSTRTDDGNGSPPS